MISQNKTARTAGLIYLINVVTGIFSLMYVPSKLIVWNNAATTFHNITTNETLFRFGIVAYLTCYIAFLFLPLVLFKLLKSVNRNYAELMVLLAIIQIPIAFANIQNEFNILSIISGENYLEVFSENQLQSQVLLYFNQYENGNFINSIFSGLWLFPFGYLVYKSGFLPKILGIFLMAGCFGYLISFFGGFLIPDFYKTFTSEIAGYPAPIGEIGICLWLLIMGTNKLKLQNSKFRI